MFQPIDELFNQRVDAGASSIQPDMRLLVCRATLIIQAFEPRAIGGQRTASIGGDPVDQALVTSLGLDAETIGRLMKEVGFERGDGAWKWRGRRPQRQRPAAPTGHAFAELAKLKKS